MKIVLPGGSGQVGTVLARHFHQRGDKVVVLSRKAEQRLWRVVPWDGCTPGAWMQEIDGADVVVNLTGSTINTRYTPANRKLILNTRLDSTRVVGEAIRSATRKPKLWMNASAAGIYPHARGESFDEFTTRTGADDLSTPETWRFAADVCKQWEEVFTAEDVPGTRKIALRTTLLLNPNKGSVFDVLIGLVRKGLGGHQGDGRQCISWMHDADYVRAIDLLIDDESIAGPVNLCAPAATSNAEFMRELRRAAGIGIGLPAPEIAIKISAIFMRTEPWLVLKSVNTRPGVLQTAGFDFQYTDFGSAARNLVRRWKLNAY
ncbi:MAG: TIGR01777 family oxidoreductase [Acidobacteria bacterium]|nr:TIGR01777 family oxidoreductase [Acidobacteriota bacterium]